MLGMTSKRLGEQCGAFQVGNPAAPGRHEIFLHRNWLGRDQNKKPLLNLQKIIAPLTGSKDINSTEVPIVDERTRGAVPHLARIREYIRAISAELGFYFKPGQFSIYPGVHLAEAKIEDDIKEFEGSRYVGFFRDGSALTAVMLEWERSRGGERLLSSRELIRQLRESFNISVKNVMRQS
jgi:hypothetical protein